jgi:hypothetical protein
MAAAAAAAAEAKVCSSIQVGAHQTGEVANPFFYFLLSCNAKGSRRRENR